MWPKSRGTLRPVLVATCHLGWDAKRDLRRGALGRGGSRTVWPVGRTAHGDCGTWGPRHGGSSRAQANGGPHAGREPLAGSGRGPRREEPLAGLGWPGMDGDPLARRGTLGRAGVARRRWGAPGGGSGSPWPRLPALDGRQAGEIRSQFQAVPTERCYQDGTCRTEYFKALSGPPSGAGTGATALAGGRRRGRGERRAHTARRASGGQRDRHPRRLSRVGPGRVPGVSRGDRGRRRGSAAAEGVVQNK